MNFALLLCVRLRKGGEEEFKDVTHRPPLFGGGGWTTNIFPAAAAVVSREIIERS